MITLYQFPVSGNSQKIRLMLSLLRLKFKLENVDGVKRVHKSEAFLRMNPFGQVPVLVDGEFVLRDSQAILVYLAQRYGKGAWLPLDPENLARVTAWLSTAANEVVRGPNLLRLHYRFGREIDVSAAQSAAHQLLHILEAQLSQVDWLVGEQPSVADIAMYPYIALSPEGKVDLTLFPAVLRWLGRIEKLPGYAN